MRTTIPVNSTRSNYYYSQKFRYKRVLVFCFFKSIKNKLIIIQILPRTTLAEREKSTEHLSFSWKNSIPSTVEGNNEWSYLTKSDNLICYLQFDCFDFCTLMTERSELEWNGMFSEKNVSLLICSFFCKETNCSMD